MSCSLRWQVRPWNSNKMIYVSEEVVEADESLDKVKVLEKENDCLLEVILFSDVMFTILHNSDNICENKLSELENTNQESEIIALQKKISKILKQAVDVKADFSKRLFVLQRNFDNLGKHKISLEIQLQNQSLTLEISCVAVAVGREEAAGGQIVSKPQQVRVLRRGSSKYSHVDINSKWSRSKLLIFICPLLDYDKKGEEDVNREIHDLNFRGSFDFIRLYDKVCTRTYLFVCENVEVVSSPMIVVAKLLVLNPGEFELWKMRIKQYFLMTNYALWEVIINGDSPPPKRTIDGVEQTYPPTTVEEKLARKNELKARGTLLMALP
ncbi:hypothetical protein Tco_1040894 [Tanacetum coccineum]|uniref:Uncharacterized protein n=1 Tax=Tanacetum coccineum TaxID=301880 RepID=A0ABQ5GF78_9ASTR